MSVVIDRRRTAEVLKSVVSVGKLKEVLGGYEPLWSTEGMYTQVALGVITSIRVVKGDSVPVLGMNGRALRDVKLDPLNVFVDESDCADGRFRVLGCPFIKMSTLKRCSLENVDDDVMLEVVGYNIRTDFPVGWCSGDPSYIHWDFI